MFMESDVYGIDEIAFTMVTKKKGKKGHIGVG